MPRIAWYSLVPRARYSPPVCVELLRSTGSIQLGRGAARPKHGSVGSGLGQGSALKTAWNVWLAKLMVSMYWLSWYPTPRMSGPPWSWPLRNGLLEYDSDPAV